MQILWGKPHIKTIPSLWENMCRMWQDGALQEGVQEQKKLVVHEVEIDMEPESQGEDTDIVSINSLYINRKLSSIMAKLEMQADKTALEIPYKIDTGSEGNIMPLYIFQKLFASISKDQFKRLAKGNIKLKM